MKISDNTAAVLFSLPALITAGASNPTFWHAVVGESKMAENLHLAMICVSCVPAVGSFVYFLRGKPSPLPIQFCLILNSLWLVVVVLGLIFDLDFK